MTGATGGFPAPHRGIEVVPPWLGPVLDDGGDPGLEALRRAASTRRPGDAEGRASAVLVLLGGDAAAVDRPEDSLVVLTHRSTELRSHAGQMSFPGGKADPGDAGPVDTALREAEEETGLARSSVTPLRVLDSIDIARTGFAVHPVLAYWHDPHPLRVVDPAETDAVLQVPLADLIDPGNRLTVGYGSWSGPAFRVGDYVVWGFTGGVLAHLLDAAGWTVPWDHCTVHDLRATLAASANRESFGMGGRLR